jgi:hypothetical protein
MMGPQQIWYHSIRGVVIVAMTLVTSVSALAQTKDTVTIDNTGVGASGVVGVNAAAGVFNQQANSGVIADGDLAVAVNSVSQNLVNNSWGASSPPDPLPEGYTPPCEVAQDACHQKAFISGNSFAFATGVIGVNGAAGAENQQANLFTIGIEGQVASLEMLSQTRASQEPAGNLDVPTEQKTANIESTAFDSAVGLVQVNLTAGERNSSANLFALTVAGGTDF